MKKVYLLLCLLVIYSSTLFARGGANDEHYSLSTNTAIINYTPSTNEGLKCWHISTDLNQYLLISYTVQLAEGDVFIIHDGDDRNSAEIVSFSNSSSEIKTFVGVISTTHLSGAAYIELDLLGGNINNTSNLQFCYMPAPSIGCQNLLINGNIGVGTDSPSCALDVRGTMRANEVLVDIPAGADFVFDPAYELPSLDELSTYLNNNRHLPGVESAEEMEKNGVSVNELQIKLLQKIEELTLYVIQQQKEISELKSIIVPNF